MSTSKKRKKAYKPKLVRPNPLIYNITDRKLSKESAETVFLLGIKDLETGKATPESFIKLISTLDDALILSSRFSNEVEVQMVLILAQAAICTCQEFYAEHKPTPSSVFIPLRIAAELMAEMIDQSSPAEIHAAYRYSETHYLNLRIKSPKVLCFEPRQSDEANQRFIAEVDGMKLLAIVNEKPRAGYLAWDGRPIFVVPSENIQVPLSTPIFALAYDNFLEVTEDNKK